MALPPRKRFYIELTEQEIEGLDAFLTRNGVNRTAFFAALGTLGRRSNPDLRRVLDHAREIQSGRKDRGR